MSFFENKDYYIISMLIIVVAIIFFVLQFEKRKPTTREIVSLSVMVSLAVIGRTVFFMTPQFKPMTAVVILSAVAFGKESGFLCGTLAAFISNFFFGQGPWTPWQMFALGMVGYISGVLFYKRYNGKRPESKGMILLSIYGGLVTLFVYGTIMDMATVFMYTEAPTLEAIFAACATGFLFNVIHGISTMVIILVMGKQVLGKINRMKIKFGMFR